jgi:hypothetical protein
MVLSQLNPWAHVQKPAVGPAADHGLLPVGPLVLLGVLFGCMQVFILGHNSANHKFQFKK